MSRKSLSTVFETKIHPAEEPCDVFPVKAHTHQRQRLPNRICQPSQLNYVHLRHIWDSDIISGIKEITCILLWNSKVIITILSLHLSLLNTDKIDLRSRSYIRFVSFKTFGRLSPNPCVLHVFHDLIRLFY